METKTSLKIDYATHESAVYACKNWHYSRSVPAGKTFKLGVWEDEVFVGAVIFGVGIQNNLVRPYGLKPTQGCELVRIALKKHRTTVTRIVSIGLKFLKKKNPGLRLVVSYADPNEGHHGGIYQGGGWIYTGKTPDDRTYFVDGKRTHPRTVSHLVRAGSVKNRSDLQSNPISGKHRYLMPLDQEMRKKLVPLTKPYPKRAGSKGSVAPEFHSGEGGETPTPALQSAGGHGP